MTPDIDLHARTESNEFSRDKSLGRIASSGDLVSGNSHYEWETKPKNTQTKPNPPNPEHLHVEISIPEMFKTDDTHGSENHGRGRKSRQRISTSCSECKRRKQKCNKARDRPCNNCARRYPPVDCVYTDAPKQNNILEALVELDSTVIKSESDDISPPRLSHNSSGLKTTISSYGTSRIAILPSQPHDRVGDERYVVGRTAFATGIRSTQDETAQAKYKDWYTDITGLLRVESQNPPYFSHFYQPQDKMPMQVGDVRVERLYSLPIEPTRRNAELFHFFVQRLSGFVSSIDGTQPPAAFMSQWIPFMIQSPMIIYLCILTSAYFQAAALRIDVEKSVEVVTTRVKVINLINAHISANNKGVNDGAIAAVIGLAFNELVYSDRKSTTAHMRGVREMVKARGGLESISVQVLRMMVTRTDYQIACTFECSPIIQGPQEVVHVSKIYPSELENPFLLSQRSFRESAEENDISGAAAAILDDMKFITASLLSLGVAQDNDQARTKFLATVQWIHNRLTSGEPDPALANDMLYQTCRATAVIYTTAILSRKPLSVACTGELLSKVWMTMWQVPLPRWKKIPGVFFFVLLIVNPFSCARPEGRFIKGLFAASTIAIGFVDWDIVTAILKAFLGVQKWLGGSDESRVFYEDRLAVSRSPAGGIPAWSFNR